MVAEIAGEETEVKGLTDRVVKPGWLVGVVIFMLVGVAKPFMTDWLVGVAKPFMTAWLVGVAKPFVTDWLTLSWAMRLV